MNKRQLSHLNSAAQKDEIYQDLQTLVNLYEPEYQRILRTLSPRDRHLLHMYIAAREGLESRMARTAYFLTPK